MRYSKGITWIDDCRIPFKDEEDIDFNALERKGDNNEILYKGGFTKKYETTYYKTEGRFTPNLLVCDDVLNDGVISKSSDNKWIGGKEKNWEGHTNKRIHTYSDKGSNSRYYDLDLWFNHLINKL